MDLIDLVNQFRELPTVYYLLRDRLPFFLTLVWIYRWKIPDTYRDFLGKTLISIISIVWVGSLYLVIVNKPMTYLYGIRWSHPAPVEWGIFILWVYWYLRKTGVKPFTSIYLGVLAGSGAGWLYETQTWVKNRDFVKLLGVNYHKVFFVDYQIICLISLLVVLFYSREVNYRVPKYLGAVSGVHFAYLFFLSPVVMSFLYELMHKNAWLWRWFIRVPTILYLGYIVSGVHKKGLGYCIE